MLRYILEYNQYNDEEIFQDFLRYNDKQSVFGKINLNSEYFDKDCVIEVWKNLPYKTPSGKVFTKEDGISAIRNSMDYGHISDGACGVSEWLYNTKRLYENGGILLIKDFTK